MHHKDLIRSFLCYTNYGGNMDKEEYKITIKKFFGHLHTVNAHRFRVFCLCFKVGIPLQGLIHDLSKYSPTEFLEGAKYYAGTYSPIMNCKKDIGYRKAWLHHKGRNKHHFQYWYDYAAPIKTPIMPFKYFLEMICDDLAAGMTYQGKKWYPGYQLTYWNKVREEAKMNETMKQLLDKVYTEISLHGLKVLKRKQIKEWYDSYIK